MDKCSYFCRIIPKITLLKFNVVVSALLVFLIPFFATAQKDTIVAKNGDVISGEVKGMTKSVLKMKTNYSDSDFAIEWNGIKQIKTKTTFLVTTTDANQYDGYLSSINDREVLVLHINDTLASIPLSSIVYLRTLKSDFWSRLSASLALGYNFTKSNNSSQFSLRSTLGYETKNWMTNANFNTISATRDDAQAVDRTDASLSYRYFLRKDWFPLIEVNWLSNTEQNLKLRTVSRVGMGKYIMRNNKMYWGVQAGTSYNNESFSGPDAISQNSLEGFVGSELNLYNIGDLSLLTKAIVYPGITESGRIRFDGNIDLKYDLPLDFFVKVGVTVNYDNRSVTAASDTDYIFQTSFGWEL